jgi:hypothetical protein
VESLSLSTKDVAWRKKTAKSGVFDLAMSMLMLMLMLICSSEMNMRNLDDRVPYVDERNVAAG